MIFGLFTARESICCLIVLNSLYWFIAVSTESGCCRNNCYCYCYSDCIYSVHFDSIKLCTHDTHKLCTHDTHKHSLDIYKYSLTLPHIRLLSHIKGPFDAVMNAGSCSSDTDDPDC